MTWDFYGDGKGFVYKAKKEVPRELLATLDEKGRRRLKKTLQSAEPTEFFGQDFTKLGDLIKMLRELDLIKSDRKMDKKWSQWMSAMLILWPPLRNSERSMSCCTDN